MYYRHAVDERRAPGLLDDLKNLDFKKEILPFNQHNLTLLKKDFVFWAVVVLSVVPLMLVTLQDPVTQLTGFCLFFAGIWGVIFKKFIVEDSGGWVFPVAALFFTGVPGLAGLLHVFTALPDSYNNLPEHPDAIYRLMGSIFHTGFWEEGLKILPVLAFIAFKKQSTNALSIVMVGVFSGLGFAAFENLGYANMAVSRTMALTNQAGADGLVAGVQGAMVNVMLRSLSLIFNHAMWCGIFSYFVAVGWLTGKRKLALGLVGWSVAMLNHGFYNWSTSIQATLPGIIVAFGFVLFYSYLTKLRLMIASGGSGSPRG